MNPLLVVLNARRIPECMAAFSALNVAKAFLQGYTERGLCEAFPALVEATDYSHYLAVSDDVVVSQGALDAVVALLPEHPVVTGFCNLDATSPLVNLTKQPLLSEQPCVEAYDFYSRAEVEGHESDPVPTGFAGMCVSGMSRELWREFPFGCYGDPGWGSDFSMSKRATDAGLLIVAPKAGAVHHLKQVWNRGGSGGAGPFSELLIGQDVGVRFEGE